MKKSVTALLLFLLLAAGEAFAKVKEFDYFSVDVPKGWKVSHKDGSVRVRKADKSASITITIESKNGRSIKEIASKLSGKDIKLEKDEDGDYTYKSKDGDTQALLGELEGFYIFMRMNGVKSAEAELDAIMDSIEFNDKLGQDASGGGGGDDDDGDGGDDDGTGGS